MRGVLLSIENMKQKVVFNCSVFVKEGKTVGEQVAALMLHIKHIETDSWVPARGQDHHHRLKQKKQLRKVLEDPWMNLLWNTENMLHPEVKELQRADNSLILRRWQKIQPPERNRLPAPVSLSPKARQKSKPKTTKHSPQGWTIPWTIQAAHEVWEKTQQC